MSNGTSAVNVSPAAPQSSIVSLLIVPANDTQGHGPVAPWTVTKSEVHSLHSEVVALPMQRTLPAGPTKMCEFGLNGSGIIGHQ